ncbi:MAG: hypothetical protein ACU83V_04685 [Gammaproteobacteria bacterium]
MMTCRLRKTLDGEHWLKVGDEKWKDDVFIYIGKQMRKTAIEFFPTYQLAQVKAWLSENNARSMFLA